MTMQTLVLPGDQFAEDKFQARSTAVVSRHQFVLVARQDSRRSKKRLTVLESLSRPRKIINKHLKSHGFPLVFHMFSICSMPGRCNPLGTGWAWLGPCATFEGPKKAGAHAGGHSRDADASSYS